MQPQNTENGPIAQDRAQALATQAVAITLDAVRHWFDASLSTRIDTQLIARRVARRIRDEISEIETDLIRQYSHDD